MTSTRYGETQHNLFQVQQWIMNGEQSTKTHLLMSTRLATGTFSDLHPQLTHNKLETAYSCYKRQYVTWWNAKPATCRNLVQAVMKSWNLGYVTRFVKTQHNGACWSFQYKAFIKTNAFHKKLVERWLGCGNSNLQKLGTIRLLITWGV